MEWDWWFMRRMCVERMTPGLILMTAPPSMTRACDLENFTEHLGAAAGDDYVVHGGEDLEGFLDVFEEFIVG
jgi:hypothetical protein